MRPPRPLPDQEQRRRVGISGGPLAAELPAEQDFGRLYKEAFEFAIRCAWDILGDLSAAEDAVQAAALELYPQWDKLPLDDQRVSTFLTRVEFRALDHKRRSRRSQPLPEEHDADDVRE